MKTKRNLRKKKGPILLQENDNTKGHTCKLNTLWKW